MQLIKTKAGWKVKLEDFPTPAQVDTLNSKRIGYYWLDTERGYKRLLVTTNPHGPIWQQVTMEAPIKEWFKM